MPEGSIAGCNHVYELMQQRLYEALPELRCTLAVSPLNDLAVVARERIPVDDTGETVPGIGYAPEWIDFLQTRAR